MTDQAPETARQLAGELADAFETDRGLAKQQNRAQDRLRAANDRLWSGLHPDALGLVYDGAAAAGQGASAIGEGIVDAVRAGGLAAEVEALVLGELQEVHWAIHRAFSEHQQLAEDRRHLAAEIGELIAALVAELVAAGWSEEAAGTADVGQLATAVAR
ncbi:MAG: hypothetical protein ACR2NR_20230 [Solirubrobacteraceae bacterium]